MLHRQPSPVARRTNTNKSNNPQRNIYAKFAFAFDVRYRTFVSQLDLYSHRSNHSITVLFRS